MSPAYTDYNEVNKFKNKTEIIDEAWDSRTTDCVAEEVITVISRLTTDVQIAERHCSKFNKVYMDR